MFSLFMAAQKGKTQKLFFKKQTSNAISNVSVNIKCDWMNYISLLHLKISSVSQGRLSVKSYTKYSLWCNIINLQGFLKPFIMGS